MLTGSTLEPAGVEVGILVEGDLEGAVRVTKYVAAFPAMVPSREVGEGSPACRMVAHGRLVIGLPMFPRGWTGWDRELVEVPALVHALPAVASRSPAQSAQCAQTAQAYEAAVRFQHPLFFLLILQRRLLGRLLRRELRRSQDGRHKERPYWARHVVLGRSGRRISGGADGGYLGGVWLCRREGRERWLLWELLGLRLEKGRVLVGLQGHDQVGRHFEVLITVATPL